MLFFTFDSLLKKLIHFIFRTWIRLTTYFFFEKVIVEGKENIPENVPVILASNHPDSFLDPLLITSFYSRPIYYMARGDVFVNKFVSSLLGFINIIPIYRKQEGIENFPKNDLTFAFCLQTFKKNGSVLIFSEGGSENKWELRPLKKGTARLAHGAWFNEEKIDNLQVLPVTINYSSWLGINCVAHLTFAKPLQKNGFPADIEQGHFLRKFNETLSATLAENCVAVNYENNADLQKNLAGFFLRNFRNGKQLAMQVLENFNSVDEAKKVKAISFAKFLQVNNLKYFGYSNLFTVLPAIVIYITATLLNLIPYSVCKLIAKSTTKMNEFFDSVFYCTLLFFYPVYLLSLFLVITLCTHSLLYGVSLLAATLITAKLREWSKKQIHCFVKQKQVKEVVQLINGLF